MRTVRVWIRVAVVSFSSLLATAHLAWGQAPTSSVSGAARDRARPVFCKSLSKMNGEHLKAVLLEIRYGPGEASSPHSHPCAVIGYVVEGTLRTQVKGEPEMIYKAGDSFYEAPGGVHLVSANASSTEPAKFIALMICDHDAPLSVDVRENPHPEGSLQ